MPAPPNDYGTRIFEEQAMDIAKTTYYEFCEDSDNSPLRTAWAYWEQEYGDIEINSLTEKLVIASIWLGVWVSLISTKTMAQPASKQQNMIDIYLTPKGFKAVRLIAMTVAVVAITGFLVKAFWLTGVACLLVWPFGLAWLIGHPAK